MLNCIKNNKGRIKPSHLLYKANMAHTQMKSYLEELISKEYVEVEITKNNREYFLITDKGLILIDKIKEIKEFDDVFGI